jgi:CubicO group peptidase (beta-lactamase class C family)
MSGLIKAITIFSIACIITACGGGGGGSDTSTEHTTTDEYDKYVSSLGFSGTILVNINGTDVLRKAYGYSDRSSAVINSLDTRFRIGSITKSFTALAIVQLKNASLLDYDDHLSEFIPDYPRGNEITIRHLLKHESGIVDYVQYINKTRSYTPNELVALVKNRTLSFAPGEMLSYSNSNYLILGYIVELITSSDYASYINTHITTPLGMNDTEYGTTIIEGPEYAKGYQDNLQTVPAQYYDMTIPQGAGALSSTLVDLEIWGRSFLEMTLINQQDREDIFSGNYGFGWVITKEGRRLVYSHEGAINGFRSLIVLYPENNGIVVVLSNTEESDEIIGDIVKRIVKNEL